MSEYPWFNTVNGESLEQGDILRAFRIYHPPVEVSLDADGSPVGTPEFTWEELDLIVISQTCDLVPAREKVEHVLTCAVWPLNALQGHLGTEKGREEARRGNLPGVHLLNRCELPGFETGFAIVDFRRVYSVPLAHFRRRAAAAGDRIRLMPPYREHLSQAFARFFMRVGLPVDVPPFKT